MAEQAEEEEERMSNNDDDNNQGSHQRVIKDDDSQWQKVNQEPVTPEAMLSDDAVQEEGALYKELGDGETGYQIKVIEEGGDEQTTFLTAGEPAASKMPAEEAREEPERTHEPPNSNNEDQQWEDQVGWSKEVNYCEDLAYRIQVVNYSDSAIECSLSFEEQEPCDLFYPRGGF